MQKRYQIKKGDRITLAMRNYPEWSIVFWATAIVGAVIVPLNAWGTGPELEAQATEVLKRAEFAVTVDLGLGQGEAVYYTSDLTYEYVKINAAYRT